MLIIIRQTDIAYRNMCKNTFGFGTPHAADTAQYSVIYFRHSAFGLDQKFRKKKKLRFVSDLMCLNTA